MSKFIYITDEELNKIIKITKEFKKKRPYRGSRKQKYKKWKEYISELSAALNIPAPHFFVAPELITDYGLFGFYNPKLNFIGISKFSIITLLHEMYHAIVHARKGVQNEHDPYIFAQHIFRAVFGEPHGYAAQPME